MRVRKTAPCSRRRAVARRGRGILNTLINKLPFELHIPGYKFCGPGTRLDKRLARGDRGVNPLDEACRDHDIAYSASNDLQKRHEADKILTKKALERVRSKAASFGEKAAALAVAGLMKGKTAIGMGVSKKRRGPRKSKSRKTTKKRRNIVGMGVSKKRRTRKTTIAAHKRGRILKTPKIGGFLPLLLPLLGALGGLAGGGAAIAKAVGDSKSQAKTLAEKERHDRAMETIARAGKGLYLRPYLPKNYR